MIGNIQMYIWMVLAINFFFAAQKFGIGFRHKLIYYFIDGFSTTKTYKKISKCTKLAYSKTTWINENFKLSCLFVELRQRKVTSGYAQFQQGQTAIRTEVMDKLDKQKNILKTTSNVNIFNITFILGYIRKTKNNISAWVSFWVLNWWTNTFIEDLRS